VSQWQPHPLVNPFHHPPSTSSFRLSTSAFRIASEPLPPLSVVPEDETQITSLVGLWRGSRALDLGLHFGLGSGCTKSAGNAPSDAGAGASAASGCSSTTNYHPESSLDSDASDGST
jgi:hypothetical protein